MKRKIAALLLAGVLAGTGGQGGIVLAAETTTETEAPAETEEASEAASEAEAETMSEEERTEAAAQLLTDLTGSYTQLWDVLLADDYKDEWLNDCKAIVGDDDAEAAVEMLQASVTGTVYGEEAVETYKDGDSMAFDCDFLQGVTEFTFDGNKISGVDADGNEVFSHEYEYVEYVDDLDFYVYETADEDAGEFTYFLMRSDTPESTAHIEFRYGSDLDALKDFMEGEYAYWMASGIPTENTDEYAKESIQIFCEENLQGEE